MSFFRTTSRLSPRRFAALASALLALAFTMTAAMASALPPVNGGSENDPVPRLPLPEEECPEDLGEEICTVIVVTAPEQDPEPEPEEPDPPTNWDIELPLGGGVSAGAGSDANKKLDLLLVKLDKRMAAMEPTCAATTGNFWDGRDPHELAEALNLVLRVAHSPDQKGTDPLPLPPELDVMLDADELERRWHDAGEYLKAHGWVYDRHAKPPRWKRFECA